MSFISAGFFMAMALTACLYYLIPKNTSGSCCFLSASAFMPLTESAIWAIFCLRLLQATVLQG